MRMAKNVLSFLPRKERRILFCWQRPTRREKYADFPQGTRSAQGWALFVLTVIGNGAGGLQNRIISEIGNRGAITFSFGDMWDIIAPDIEDVIAPDIDDCIARYLRLAKLYGVFGVAESGAEARYLDYPESGAPIRARMAVIEAGDGAQLETAYPVFAGYPARAHIVARYDWDNGVCGFLSLSVSEGSSLNFFVPSYGVSRRQCVPGSSVAVVISGLAVRFEKIRQAFFAAEHDSRREKFLEENLGKAVADFDVPVGCMEISVTAFPTGATCWYCIVAPVREVAEVQFDGRMFYQILLPIGRTASKEDVLAYIYAEKRANRDFDPVAGDLIQCLTWLCADPVPQGRGPKAAATKGDSSS